MVDGLAVVCYAAVLHMILDYVVFNSIKMQI